MSLSGALVVALVVVVGVALNLLSNWLPTPAWLTRRRILAGIVLLVVVTVIMTLAQQHSEAEGTSPRADPTSAAPTTGSPSASATGSPSVKPTATRTQSRAPATRTVTPPTTAPVNDAPRAGPVSGTDSTGQLRVTLPGTFTIGGDIRVLATFTNETGDTLPRPTLTIELYGGGCLHPEDVVVESSSPETVYHSSRGGLNGLDCVVTVSGELDTDMAAGATVSQAPKLRLLGPADLSQVNVAVGVYESTTGAWYTSQRTARLTRA